jgi:hypothetical protein
MLGRRQELEPDDDSSIYEYDFSTDSEVEASSEFQLSVLDTSEEIDTEYLFDESDGWDYFHSFQQAPSHTSAQQNSGFVASPIADEEQPFSDENPVNLADYANQIPQILNLHQQWQAFLTLFQLKTYKKKSWLTEETS